MRLGTKGIIAGLFLLALSTGIQAAERDKRLDYPIEWMDKVPTLVGAPSIRILYESGCFKNIESNGKTISSSVRSRSFTDTGVDYIVDIKLDGVPLLSVTAHYRLNTDTERATLILIETVNRKSGASQSYAYDGTANSAGRCVGALCEIGKLYLDFDKINSLLME